MIFVIEAMNCGNYPVLDYSGELRTGQFILVYCVFYHLQAWVLQYFKICKLNLKIKRYLRCGHIW